MDAHAKTLVSALFVLMGLSYATSATCPGECRCFGYNGEWIADCSRRSLLSTANLTFDADTTEIHLQENGMEVLHMTPFLGLSKLKHLYLQSNKIKTFPDGMFNEFPNLQTLRVNSNGLSDLGENSFSSLHDLVVLYAHDNKLEEIKESAFAGLDSLRHLSIADNPTLTKIHRNALQLNLTMLDISLSSVTHLQPLHFSGNPNLYRVYLNNIESLNCTEDLIPFIEWLDESGDIVGEDASTMKCAEPEYLRGQSLAYITSANIVKDDDCPDGCECFDNIVDCARRKHTNIPVGFAPDTEEIFLEYTNLTHLNNTPFSHLKKLMHLYLHENKISTLHKDVFVGAASSLRQLTLQKNLLTEVSDGIFRFMRALQVLNLNGNMLKTISSGAFSNMASLVQLSLQNNMLSTLDEDIFANLWSLKYLGLANNDLTTIPVLPNDLTFFDATGNQIVALPTIPPEVTRVTIRNGSIKSITRESMQLAGKLQILDLTGNDVSEVEDKAFDGATNLQELYLGENSLAKIDDSTFASAKRLQLIDLSHNEKLTKVSTYAFYAQRKTLSDLDVSHCQLSTMSGQTLSVMEQKGFRATLQNNPWMCDCSLRGLAKYISDNPAKVSDAFCAGPETEEENAVKDVDYEEKCHDEGKSGVQDESRALVMGLTISFTVVLVIFVAAIVWLKSKKDDAKSFQIHTESVKPRFSSGPSYENTTFHED